MNIPIPHLPVKLYVVTTRKEAEAVKETEKLPDVPWEDGDTLGMTKSYGDEVCVIAIPRTTQEAWNISTIQTIAHESYHALRAIEHAIEERDPGTEHPAYLLDYIVGEVAKVVCRKVTRR